MSRKGKSNPQPSDSTFSEFDKSKEADALFVFLRKHLACIALFNLLFKKKITLSEITDSINACEYNNRFDFLYKSRCSKCSSAPRWTLADNSFEREEKKRVCTNCNTDRYVTNEVVWPLDEWAIEALFKYGMKVGVFAPKQYVQCQFCGHGFQVQENTKEIGLSCSECKKPIKVDLEFRLNDAIAKNLSSESRQGYWLEWYLGRILLEKGKQVQRNIKYAVDNQKIEIDLAYQQNGNLICVDCDTSRDSEFDIENFHLIPKADNFIKIVLVTTNKNIDPKIISAAKKHFYEVIQVCFKDLDSIDKKLPT